MQSIIVSTLAAILLAQSAPAPLSDSEADIEAWEKQYVDKKQYAGFDTLEDGLSYLYLEGLQDLTKPVVRVWVRNEYFRPQTVEGRTFRSTVELFDFDCDGHRARSLALDAYPELNMTGSGRSTNVQEPQWKYPRLNEPLGEQLRYVCEVKGQSDPRDEDGVAKPSAAMPVGLPPASTSDADIERWIAANVDINGGYVFEYIPRGVVILYMKPPNGDKPVGVKARFEYFIPQEIEGALFRSSRLNYDVDCRRKQISVHGAEYFTEQNLGGTMKSQGFDNRWAKPPSGFDGQVELICREMREPGYALSVRKAIQPVDDDPQQRGGPRLMPKRR